MTLDLLTDLMGKAEGRCAYAEARHVEWRDEALSVRAVSTMPMNSPR